MNQHVQKELIEEVNEVLSTLDGKAIGYEALHKMKFLDQVISESLRHWPPVMATDRECTKDYKMDLGNGKTVLIKKGESVMIPINSIHHDEKYFDQPYLFDPHRFDDDRKDSIIPGSYIPFG
jgi:cytochrome P450 family 9